MKELPSQYYKIPTPLEVEDSHAWVDDLIKLAESGEYSKIDIAEALVELLERLTDRYSRFEKVSASRIFRWIEGNFDVENYSLVDACLTLLMNIGNPIEALKFVESNTVNCKDREVHALLKEFCREIEEDHKRG